MSLFGWLVPWWAKALGALAVVAVLAWGAWHVYSRVTDAAYTAGYNARVVAEAVAAANAKAVSERRDTDSAKVSQQFQAKVAKVIPAIEESSHETQERVRTIYRDVPVPVACVRPAGVLRELEAARARANAAATTPAG